MPHLNDLLSVATNIPEQIRRQMLTNRARLFAAIFAMNILWAFWGLTIERFVVGMDWFAVAELRLSALFWNTIFAVLWTGHIEHGLSEHWQRPCRTPLCHIRWYLVALEISLLSQVPVQVVAYVPPVIWGEAVWSEVQQSWAIALLFSPLIGVYFASLQMRLERILDLLPGMTSEVVGEQ